MRKKWKYSTFWFWILKSKFQIYGNICFWPASEERRFRIFPRRSSFSFNYDGIIIVFKILSLAWAYIGPIYSLTDFLCYGIYFFLQ